MIRMLENTKAAAAAASSMISAWFVDLLGLIPDDITKLASLVGVVLSCVLIVTHTRKGTLEVKLLKMQLLKMQLQEKEKDRSETGQAD